VGRLRDAWHALAGRTTPQIEVARMKAEWAGLQIEILNTMEKLNQLAGRIAKRESRAAAKTLEAHAPDGESPASDAPDAQIPSPRWGRKAEILRLAREKRKVGNA